MKLSRIAPCLLIMSLLGCTALADNNSVKREVGSDGVPVITIKGKKRPTPPPVSEPLELEPAERPAFKVYDMGGEETPSQGKPQIVVVGSPPPIAPNPAAWGYGNGFFPGNGFGPGFGPGFVGGGFYGPAFYNGAAFQGNFYNRGIGVTANGAFFSNYQNPPVNYQNPPINYQNPPANYRPVNVYRGFVPGNFYRGGYRCR